MENSGQSSDADKIRLKRLAKLQQEADDRKKREAEEAQNRPEKSAPVKLREPLPTKEPLEHKFTIPASQQKITPSVPAITRSPPVKSFENWQNDALSRILQVTLDPEATSKHGRCIYLRNLVTELEQENEHRPFLLSQALMDRGLVERLSLDPNEPHEELSFDMNQDLRVPLFDYLLSCWKRAQEIRKNMVAKNKSLDEVSLKQRMVVIDAAKRLVVSYSGLVLQMPDIFPQLEGRELGPEQIVPRLLAELDTPEGLPSSYLSELVARFDGDGLELVLGPALTAIATPAKRFDLLGDFKSSLQSLAVLCENKAVAAVLPAVTNFDPSNANARNIEDLSFLGPYLQLTGYPSSAPNVAKSLFQTVVNRNSADKEAAKSALRGTVHMLQRAIFSVCNSIVRANATARESLLAYFTHIIRLNEKRAQMQVDIESVATEGFMHNISVILLTFCDPFLDIRASKIDKIQSTYLRSGGRLNVKEDTKINASKEQSDEYYNESHPAQAYNFITESFFLTLAFLHYGPIRSLVNYNDFMRKYSDAKKQVEIMEAEAFRTANTSQGVMQDFVLKQLKAKLETMAMQKLAYESMVLDREFIAQIMRFYNLVMAWLIRIADPLQKHPWTPVKLPLPSNIPEAFSMLPEWIIEDIVEFFIFLGKYDVENRVIGSNPLEELATFTITFLRNPKYVNNPYLKAKLVEILFFYTYPVGQERQNSFEVVLNSHPLALEHLVPSLMRFYVDVEQTGASSQFYDKFNIRYNISHIMKTIRSHPAHREKLRSESKNSEVFTRFVNMLMSDVTYLLDESLSKLTEIHQVQSEMKDTEAWNAQNPTHRQEREGQFRALERQTQSYVALGNETVNMLQYMTAEVAESFLVSEIVDRLAAMLDYNLSQLVGPKCTELKVNDREKYHFEPLELLSQIIDIYLNLNTPPLVEAVARDGRSYRKEYFSKAAAILLKHRAKSPDEVDKLKLFVERVEDAVKCSVEEEEELGEVPEEFQDPIFFTIMEDPVLLPTSSVIVDRSTIRAHLLGDTRDPFNRAPLSMDMVQPATELKEKILEWRAQQKKSKKDVMDTTE